MTLPPALLSGAESVGVTQFLASAKTRQQILIPPFGRTGSVFDRAMKFNTSDGRTIEQDPSETKQRVLVVGDQVVAVSTTEGCDNPPEVVFNDKNTLNYRSVAEGLADATGVVLTTLQLQLLLADQSRLVSRLHEWGVEALLDEMADLLANDLLSERWPTHGDANPNADEFVSRLHQAAKMKGYEVR